MIYKLTPVQKTELQKAVTSYEQARAVEDQAKFEVMKAKEKMDSTYALVCDSLKIDSKKRWSVDVEKGIISEPPTKSQQIKNDLKMAEMKVSKSKKAASHESKNAAKK